MAININNLNNASQVKQKLEQQVQTKQQVTQNTDISQQAKLATRDSVSITPQATVSYTHLTLPTTPYV